MNLLKQFRTLNAILASFVILLFLAGCSNLAADAFPTTTFTPLPPTATKTFTPPPTLTPTATITPTPPQLPPGFTTSLLNSLDTPHTYINDTCQVLLAKLDPNNSVPGTVVMPIMLHSITDGTVSFYDQISVETWKLLIRDLREQGFEAITIIQFRDFIYNNSRIPPRSVLFIVDDRKTAEYFNTHFRPLYEDYGWKVTNAWISSPETTEDLWSQNISLEQEGWVDHQAHGVIHNTNITEVSTEEFMRSEIFGSRQIIEQRFNKTPIAYIWPGGSFTQRAIQIAREAGYQLGFTINPRGPVMFNWIPLSEQGDPMRPSYIVEGTMGDPLMVLPRFWDTDARSKIDLVRQIGQQAAEAANSSKQVETDYYNIVCSASLGPLPTAAP
jgi:hypothetical protein